MAADIKHVHGKQACSCQVKTLEMIESRLRAIGAIKQDLSGLITQQAFSTDVKASGGTHDGGGVWDVKFTVVDTIEKRRAWRESGAWATFRTKDQGPWPDHGHVNWVGCPHMSEPAKRQVKKYRRGLNGLKGDGPDQAPRLKVVTWEQALAAFNQPKGCAGEAEEGDRPCAAGEDSGAAPGGRPEHGGDQRPGEGQAGRPRAGGPESGSRLEAEA